MIETLTIRVGQRAVVLPKGDVYLRYHDRFEVSNEFVVPVTSFRRPPRFRPRVFLAEEVETVETAEALETARKSPARQPQKKWNSAVSSRFDEWRTPAKLRGMLVKLDRKQRR